ncbi:MAG: caspase family protein [Candidatus Thorarchaeota archaeon]
MVRTISIKRFAVFFSILSLIVLVFSSSSIFLIDSEALQKDLVTDSTNSQLPQEEFSLGISSPLIPKNAYAIVVGIADYPGSDNDLSYTDDDSQDIYSMLINDYNFKSENVIYLQDSSATLNGISNAFDSIASQISSEDIFFFYYSGHGGQEYESSGSVSWVAETPHNYPNDYDRTWSVARSGAEYMRVHFYRLSCEAGYDYLLCGDYSVNQYYYYELYSGNYGYNFWSAYLPVSRYYLRFLSDYSITYYGFRVNMYEALLPGNTHYLASYDSVPNTPSNYYLDTLLDSKLDSLNCSEKYVVVDACNSGGLIPEVQEIGRYIMTACSANQFSLESPTLQHGVFTNYFLNSIDYATDSNGDGVKSLEEYFAYVYPNTVTRSGIEGYTHHPQQYDGIPGEAVLSTGIGSLSMNPIGNNLSFSFTLYGTGLIQELYLAICQVSSGVNFDVVDLTLTAPTPTGFGSYSGSIQLDGASSLTGYGLYAKIEGERVIYLNTSVSQDFDNDTLEDLEELIYGLNPLTNDSDSDGLNDALEFYGITDPLNADTDGDGMYDGYEINNDLDPLVDDTTGDLDGDGLNNLFEYQIGTSANNNDTDYDDLSDSDELSTYLTDPTNEDSDDDGLFDGLEVFTYFTDPNNPDSEGDGMWDGFEVLYGLNYSIDDSGLDNDGDGLINLLEMIYNANPLIPDTDNDGITDGFEVLTYSTNPNNPDSDSDGMDDLFEIDHNLDPLIDDSNLDPDNDGMANLLECQCNTNPQLADSDGDFMTDFYEYNCDLDYLADDANLDEDNDGLTNLLEFLLGSLANNIDSDNDNLPDMWEYENNLNLTYDDSNLDPDNDGLTNFFEYNYPLNPQNPDCDNDGLSDGDELLIYNTDPLNMDTDGDGYSDGIEALWGTNPLDSRISINTYFFNIAGGVVLLSSSYYVTRTQVIKRRKNRQEDKMKMKKFSVNRDIKTYNTVTIDKKIKPKPIKSFYKPRTTVPSYSQSRTRPTYTDVNTVRDIILNRLPPPKSSYSSEGKRALTIANMAFTMLNQGRYKESFEYMINALILGVPEPVNSMIKKILLDSLDRSDSTTSTRERGFPSYSDPSIGIKCAWCGKMNKRSNKYCISCGRSL